MDERAAMVGGDVVGGGFGGARKTLYPALEPFRRGTLRVDAVHEL